MERRYLRMTEEIQREQRQRTIEAFLDALQAKDGAAVRELTDQLAEMGVAPSQIRRAAKERALEPNDGLLRSLTRKRRAEEAERFQKNSR